MSDALLEIALSGATSHPMLVNLETARQINLAHGAPVVAAWEVEDLTPEWVNACRRFVSDLPSIQKGLSEIEAIKENHRRNHSSFGERYKH